MTRAQVEYTLVNIRTSGVQSARHWTLSGDKIVRRLSFIVEQLSVDFAKMAGVAGSPQLLGAISIRRRRSLCGWCGDVIGGRAYRNGWGLAHLSLNGAHGATVRRPDVTWRTYGVHQSGIDLLKSVSWPICMPLCAASLSVDRQGSNYPLSVGAWRSLSIYGVDSCPFIGGEAGVSQSLGDGRRGY